MTGGRVEHLNPEGLIRNPAFTHVVVVSGPARTIYVGGQDAITGAGEIVGKGDIAAQTEQVLANLLTALAASLDIRSPDPTQPYYFRLESDQSRPIRILSDHVYLDCQQHWVSGDGSSGVGIEVNGVTDVTITNCHVSHWLWGILIRRSPNANVRANVLVFNSTGVAFEDQSTNIHLTENVLSDNSFYGLEIRTSPGPIRLVRNAFAFNGPGPRLQRDPRRHFIILSPGLITKPLEKYGNTFEPPLPGE